MVRIPMFLRSDVLECAPEEPCSAFVVGGRVLRAFPLLCSQMIDNNGPPIECKLRKPVDCV
jgi:hypothetical protein